MLFVAITRAGRVTTGCSAWVAMLKRRVVGCEAKAHE